MAFHAQNLGWGAHSRPRSVLGGDRQGQATYWILGVMDILDVLLGLNDKCPQLPGLGSIPNPGCLPLSQMKKKIALQRQRLVRGVRHLYHSPQGISSTHILLPTQLHLPCPHSRLGVTRCCAEASRKAIQE